MASDDEECSDDELFDDEWPADFFDASDDENVTKMDQIDLNTTAVLSLPTPGTSTVTAKEGAARVAFSDLPQDILRLIVEPLGLIDRMRAMRCCHALLKAVGTSKWTNLGDGRLVVIANQQFENENTTTSSLAAANQRFTVYVAIGNAVKVGLLNEKSIAVLARLHRLFGTMHLKELRLVRVPQGHELLRRLDDFIDDCTFDRLTIVDRAMINKTHRVRELMDRARYDIVFETDNKVETYVRELQEWQSEAKKLQRREKGLTLARRELLQRDSPTYLDSALFMKRVRMGDRLFNFETNLDTVEALAEIIDVVAESRTYQRIDFWCKNFSVCEEYVKKFEALQMRGEYAPYRAGIITNSYIHKRATIFLSTLDGQPHDARIEVKGQGYRQYRFIGKD